MARKPGLEGITPSNEAFHWRMQRLRKVAAFVTSLVMVAALAGLFGPDRVGSVLRASVIYLVLLILFRLYGRRTLGQITTFDFVLLLIIAEAIQQAMIREDDSLTNAFLVILTLFTVDAVLSLFKHKSGRATALLEGMPLVLVDHGRPVKRVMDSVQLDESDILSAARELQGVQRMDQIRYAVLEVNGTISIVPDRTSPSKSEAA
jgi:uncharacterized membrane protein YcaP (DUF421 family)